MYVRALGLVDFRSYPALDLALPAGTNVFVGANGQGKTNLVEAVGFVATQTSHRVATTAPLIRTGATSAVVRAVVVRDDRELLIELEVAPGRSTRARINRAPAPRARDALGLIREVTFAPEDLALVKGDPGERRRFLDDLLTARAPRYAGVRADYERVLRQRTSLLRSAAASRKGNLDTLDVWDSHLAAAGAELLAGRLELVDAMHPLLDKAYTAVAGDGGPVGATYRSGLDEEVGTASPLPTDRSELAAVLLAALRRVRPAELDRGVCLVGPHRDDLVLTVRGLPARGYASHGESWSLALALRLSAYELLRSDGTDPVLVLDDVFAELDETRRARLAERVADAEQVLVTAAVPGDVPELAVAGWFEVARGAVSRVR